MAEDAAYRFKQAGKDAVKVAATTVNRMRLASALISMTGLISFLSVALNQKDR